METVLKTWIGNQSSVEVYPTKKAAEAAGKKFMRVLRASTTEWSSAGWETIKK
jgi:hypothetical protein